ncbi:MAG: MurR/RpiR family transcriptional regulator [Longicatena sp.]
MKFYEIINKNYSALSSNDLIILEYINTHKEKCSVCSIDELSKATNFSKASIVRFSQRLGFRGFAELKVHIKMSLDKKPVVESQSQNLDVLCNRHIAAVQKLRDEDFTDMFELMYKARRVYLFGSGQVQYSACKELARIFCTEGIYLCVLDSTPNYEALSQNLSLDDIVIVVSTSGESKEIIQFAKFLKLKGIAFISITKLQQNSLASLSNVNIFFQPSQQMLYHNKSKMIESTSILFFLFEILSLKYQQFIEDKKQNLEE